MIQDQGLEAAQAADCIRERNEALTNAQGQGLEAAQGAN